MILLRPINWENIDTHYRWNNDEELNYYDSDYPHEKESYQSFLTRLKELDSDQNHTVTIFEIIDTNSNKLIGLVDIHGIDYKNKRCFMECTIAEKDFRNQGFGKTASEEALRYCFENLEMNKVLTTSFDFNDTWIHVIESLGFKQEARLRQHAIKKNEFRDKLIFGILKSEYVDQPYSKKGEKVVFSS